MPKVLNAVLHRQRLEVPVAALLREGADKRAYVFCLVIAYRLEKLY
jgi:hypothetical protein